MRPSRTRLWAWVMVYGTIILAIFCAFFAQAISELADLRGDSPATKTRLVAEVSLISGLVAGYVLSRAVRMFEKAAVADVVAPPLPADQRPTDADLEAWLDQAVAGFARIGVRATWELTHEGGEPVVRATVSNDDASVETILSGDDLRSPLHVRSRLFDVWGDTLRVESYRRIGMEPPRL